MLHTKKIIILFVIGLSNVNGFGQKFSVASSQQLLFSKSIEASQKLLNQKGFESNGSTMSKDPKGRSFNEYSFIKKSKNDKTKAEEIIVWRQEGSVNTISKFEYTTYDPNIYAAHKKDAEQNLKKLGDKKDENCVMVSYSGAKMLETFQSCNTNNITEYKIVVFNLLAVPVK